MSALTTTAALPHARATAVGPARFDISEVPEDGQRVLRLRGELDLAAAPQLRARATELALRDAVVILDLSDVEFVDVAGLCALRSLAREARGRWSLQVRGAPLAVRQLARLTGMQDLALAA